GERKRLQKRKRRLQRGRLRLPAETLLASRRQVRRRRLMEGAGTPKTPRRRGKPDTGTCWALPLSMTKLHAHNPPLPSPVAAFFSRLRCQPPAVCPSFDAFLPILCSRILSR